MKNKIIKNLLSICLILAVGLPYSVTAQQQIKTAKHYKMNLQTGEKLLRYVMHFDEEGKETKRTDYQNNTIKLEVYFEYDDKGNRIKATEKQGEETTVLGTYDYKQGNKVHEKTPYGYTFFDRDEKGDLIAERAFNIDGTIDLLLFHEYRYENANLIAKLTYEQKEVGVEKQKRKLERFAYNDKGQVIKRHLVSLYDERLFTNSYHPNGKLKETIELAFENKEKIVHKFNVDGEKVEQVVYRRKTVEEEFKLDFTNHWIYNQYGDLIERKSKRKDTIISRNVIEISYY